VYEESFNIFEGIPFQNHVENSSENLNTSIWKETDVSLEKTLEIIKWKSVVEKLD